MIAEWVGQPNQQYTPLPSRLGGPPAIHMIAEWDAWPNQQFLASQQSKRLLNGLDGPTTNTNKYINGSNQQST